MQENKNEFGEIDPVEDESSEGQNISKQIVEENAKLKENLVSVVEEIKSMREAKRLLEQEVEKLKTKPAEDNKPDPDDEKISKTVFTILEREKASKALSNKKEAFENFIKEHKEFHSSNDPTGLKKQALENKLSRFNSSGIVEKEGFYSLIEDAYNLLVNRDTDSKNSSEGHNPYTSTTVSVNQPTIVSDKELSLKEKELIERNGWTKEKYLKLKTTNPSFLEGLFGRFATE